ncbi:Hydrolyase [Rhypophila decipiens]
MPSRHTGTFFPNNTFLNFETIRILGTACYGGADLGEVLEAVSQIRENDIATTWQEAWSTQACRAEQLAEEALLLGHRNAARSAFLRASNYNRASGYMMSGESNDPRIVQILGKTTSLFQSATSLFDHPVHRLAIPYKHDEEQCAVTLSAYLYLPPPVDQHDGRFQKKTPVIINFNGADSVLEEIHYMFPAAAPSVGYAVLTVEGPGQGLTLREAGIPMRPDWEVVGSAVFDYLSSYSESHPEVRLDMDRVAVAGASLGGHLALRAVAGSRKGQYKACVAIDPPFDFYEFAVQHSGPGARTFFNLWEKGWISDSVVNGIIGLGVRFSWQMRLEICSTSQMLGVSSPADLLRAMKRFSFKEYTKEGKVESLLQSVTCPVLVTGAADSLYFDINSHTMAIADKLNGASAVAGSGQEPVKTWVGSTLGTGSLQAKMGALPLCNQKSGELRSAQMRRQSPMELDFSDFVFPSPNFFGTQQTNENTEIAGNGILTPAPWSPGRANGLGNGGFRAQGESSASLVAADLSIVFSSSDSPSAATTPTIMQDLFELCTAVVRENHDIFNNTGIRLAHDEQSTNQQQHVMETAAQRALERTSRLSDILNQIATLESADEEFNNSMNIGRNGQTGVQNTHEIRTQRRCIPDPITTSTITNAYLLLVRAWRHIFLRLHNLLRHRGHGGSRPPLILLPSLQLGGFTVQNSPAIQVVALIELSSNMLNAIECRIGIRSAVDSNHGNGDMESTSHSHQRWQQSAFNDALSVSIREMMLSQETSRITNADGQTASGTMSGGLSNRSDRGNPSSSQGMAPCCFQRNETHASQGVGRDRERGLALQKLPLRELMEEVRKCV